MSPLLEAAVGSKHRRSEAGLPMAPVRMPV